MTFESCNVFYRPKNSAKAWFLAPNDTLLSEIRQHCFSSVDDKTTPCGKVFRKLVQRRRIKSVGKNERKL